MVSQHGVDPSLPPSLTTIVNIATHYNPDIVADMSADVIPVQRRAEHKDQHYMSAAELMSPPWSNLVFWHGSDKKGQPVLYCKLGLAVRTLPRHMQDRMGCALCK